MSHKHQHLALFDLIGTLLATLAHQASLKPLWQDPGKVLRRTHVTRAAQQAEQHRVLCPDPDTHQAKRWRGDDGAEVGGCGGSGGCSWGMQRLSAANEKFGNCMTQQQRSPLRCLVLCCGVAAVYGASVVALRPVSCQLLSIAGVWTSASELCTFLNNRSRCRSLLQETEANGVDEERDPETFDDSGE